MHISKLTQVIKNRRKVLDINQMQLAELTDLGLRTIKGLEANKTNPTLKTIVTILDVLGLELAVKTKK